MLEQQQCERILSIMANHSVEDKLKAINEAKEMFRHAFTAGMNESQWAYSAMVIEQQYNYIREILQVKQIRIKADLAGGAAGIVSKAKEKKEKKEATAKAKPKAKTYATFNMESLAASFSKFQNDLKKGESNGEVIPPTTGDPNKT